MMLKNLRFFHGPKYIQKVSLAKVISVAIAHPSRTVEDLGKWGTGLEPHKFFEGRARLAFRKRAIHCCDAPLFVLELQDRSKYQ